MATLIALILNGAIMGSLLGLIEAERLVTVLAIAEHVFTHATDVRASLR